MHIPVFPGPLLILRHAETVYNATQRLQGAASDTPLTLRGFQQADAMGAALTAHFAGGGADRDRSSGLPLRLIVSPAARTLQTLAVICDHIGHDWFAAVREPRLRELEVGKSLEGERYDAPGVKFDATTGMLLPARDGESYAALSARLSDWIADEIRDGDASPRLVVTHGLAGRVLRGLLTGQPVFPEVGVPVAQRLPQGSIVAIEQGVERTIFSP